MAGGVGRAVSRSFVTPAASRDLTEIRIYLERLPARPRGRIAEELKRAIQTIVENSYMSLADSELTRILGQEVRSWPVSSYRIYFRMGRAAPEILGILHAARDHASILRQRIQ